ncbi:CRISPR-associated endonuclease Cas2 [Candidatus Uhrbacteria bacterium]|nr:CRISPR-associated endonuclease Cas2 [Candidatus Uhrbacteria bacterium]
MTKKGEIAFKILAAVGLAGVVCAAVVAPNVFQFLPNPYKRKYPKRSLDKALQRLKDRGLLKFAAGSNGWRVELTEKGREELFAYETCEKMFKKPKRWDGKWRLLVFDIEEKRKSIREMVRQTLVRLGFYRLQDSVWAHPYECEDVLELLRAKYRVRHEALYLRAEYLAKDHWLRKHFNLPLD